MKNKPHLLVPNCVHGPSPIWATCSDLRRSTKTFIPCLKNSSRPCLGTFSNIVGGTIFSFLMRLELLTFEHSQASLTLHHLLEADTRVENIQSHTSNRNEHPLEADEQALFIHQRAGPAIAQLSNSVHRAPEDTDSCERQRSNEALEHPASTGRNHGRVLAESCVAKFSMSPHCVDDEVDRADHKNEQREDLEREAGNHDIIPWNDRCVVFPRNGCDPTASALQKQ
jgi:hypothetical protein